MLEIKAGDQVVIDSLPPSYKGTHKIGDKTTVLQVSPYFGGYLTLKGDENVDCKWLRVSDLSKEKGTTESIVDMIRSRSEFGLNKYGVSMDRTDLSTEEWIQHAIEEMLDGAQYLYRIKQELGKRLDK
tara:strand:- start:235 stop:618 length:384 start_codon:yes stop_codon:yes gene_type:complete